MVRRFIAPILRLLAFILILISPILLAAIAHAEGTSLVALRPVTLAERSADRYPQGAFVRKSAPATLLERRDGKLLVETPSPKGPARGWADASAFAVLDDPELPIEGLLENARRQLNQKERPVLTAAYLREVLRRDPSRVDGWGLLGETGELLAATSRPGEGGVPPSDVTLASLWGVNVIPTPDGKGYRYDGEAWRRLIALSPPPDVAEGARLRLLMKSGPLVDPKNPTDLKAVSIREKDLGEFLASFPSSTRRIPFLLERARLLTVLAQASFSKGDFDAAQTSRDTAIEAASEVSSSAPDAARKRTAERLIARLTKSFPRRGQSEKPVVGSTGFRAAFLQRNGKTVLTVTRPDGRDAIQPYIVTGADPATLAFDPTGTKLVWDESPVPGRRRTRLLDLSKARLFEPAAFAEPELLSASPGSGPGSTPSEPADRYTTFVGFSPDGRLILVVFEGFTPDGVRIARRHFLCDVEGKGRPLLVDRPYSAPGVVDWARLQALTEKLSG